MMAPAISLDYAGPPPAAARRPWLQRIGRAIGFSLLVLIFAAVVLVRAVILSAGQICVFAGTILLFLGGRRSAGVTLTRWRAYWSDRLRLWGSDLLRPLRRQRKVVSVALLPP